MKTIRIAEYFVLIVLILLGSLLLDNTLRITEKKGYDRGYTNGRSAEFASWRKSVIDEAQGKPMVFSMEGRNVRWWVLTETKPVGDGMYYLSGSTSFVKNNYSVIWNLGSNPMKRRSIND